MPEPDRSDPADATATRWPWTMLVSAALGAWLLAAPRVMGVQAPLADLERAVGALLLLASAIACSERTRRFRLLNIPLGLALLVGTWAIGEGAGGPARVLDTVVGSAALWLAIPPGPRRRR